LKVSSRTYEEEMRRRNESKPVQVIDYSKMQESTSKPIDEPVNKFVKTPIEEKTKNVPKYVCILI